MATMQFPSILQYEGPQLDVGGNFAQGMQTGILRQQNERAQAEEARAQAEFEQKQSDREKMQGILEAMGPDATPEEIANSLLAVDPEMANKYMDLAIDKESLASERLGQQTERLRQQAVNFEMISKKQAQDRLNYKEQKTTATAWSKNFADTLSSIIDPEEKKKAQEALVKSAEADNQNRVQMGLKPIEIPEMIKSGDPDKAAAFAQEIATIGQQQLDMLRKAEMSGIEPTAEIKNYEYGLENPEFAKQLTDSAPMGETRALIQQLIDEGSASNSQEALEIIKGGAGATGKLEAEIKLGEEAEAQKEKGKKKIELEYAPKIKGLEKAAELEAVVSDELAKKSRDAETIFSITDRAKQILPAASGGAIETSVAAGKKFFGVSDASTQANTELELLSGWLVSHVPRMEGPQSNFDVDNYKKMAADVGNSMKPVGDRMVAIDGLVKLQQKYSDKKTTGTDATLSPEEQAELDELRKRFGK